MKLNELKKSKIKITNNNPLFGVERKNNFMPLLVFALITAGLAILVLAVYPLIDTMLEELASAFPPEMQASIIEVVGGGSFEDYFAMQMGQNWGLVSVIYGAYLGFHLVSYNFKGSSSTMLYSLNLSRGQIVRSKLLRLVLNSIWFNVIVGVIAVAGAYIMGQQVDLLNSAIFVGLMSLATMQIAIALFGITLIDPKKMNSVVSILVPVVLFFFSVVALMEESLKWLAYLSPISSVLVTLDASSVLTTGLAQIDYLLVAVWTIVPLLLLGIGFAKFNKKDLA